MQKKLKQNKVTDFISFLKRSWQISTPQETKTMSDTDDIIDAELISAEERARRFYRSIEEGKLAKVLDIVVDDLESVVREDRDDASAKLWKKVKKKSEKEIIKEGEVVKKSNKKFPLTFSNPISYTLLREKSLDNKSGIFTESLSLTWKYSAVAVVMMFLSVGYVSLFPARSQETVRRLDRLAIFPGEKAVMLAEYFNLLPEPSYDKKFANPLPQSKLSINKELKSDYIKNMNKGQQTSLSSDGEYIKVTENDLRKAGELPSLPDLEIAVLGVDSETDAEKDNIIVKTAKNIFKKIAAKQEQLSTDLNDKLIELIDR